MARAGFAARLQPAMTMVAALAVVLAAGGAAHAEPRISWSVENPFRLFTDADDTEVHRATFNALSPTERLNPVLAAERALSRRHPDGWAATMFDEVCWDASRNRYVCANGVDYINPASHAVIATIAGVDDAKVIDCVWLTAPRGGVVTRGVAVRQPCSEPVRFEVPYPEGSKLSLEIGGVVVASADVTVQDLLIVGMGDSFASGEGNPDLPVRFSPERSVDYGGEGRAGYPTRVGTWNEIGDKGFLKQNARWMDQACHRSLYSHQLRAALQLSLENPHRAVTFAGFACAGAEVIEGLFLRYKGNEWVPNPPDVSQVSFAADAQCGKNRALPEDLPEAYHLRGALPDLKGGLVLKKCRAEESRKIDLLLLSVGGNDIGFSRLLANAVLADESLLRMLGGWFGQVVTQSQASGQLDGLEDRFKALNRALHNILHIPWKESDRIVLTAYPGLALLGDGSATCPDGRAGMEVMDDFRLSEQKVREGVWLADKLNRIMEQSATGAGWTFADAHRDQFIGRGICAGFTDNAFSIADDLRLPRLVEGKWQPYNPADYKAYLPRQRWFRTPNDAFMTGNFHVPRSLLDKVLKLDSLSWVQLLLASTYSGAFHPTAEGQAAMADAVVARARGVLEKYAPGPAAVTDTAPRSAL